MKVLEEAIRTNTTIVMRTVGNMVPAKMEIELNVSFPSIFPQELKPGKASLLS